MKGLHRMPTLLASWGFGNAVLWYFFSHTWITMAPLGIDAKTIEADAVNPFPISFTIAAVLLLFGMLQRFADTRNVVRFAMALMLFTTVALCVLVVAMMRGWLPFGSLYSAWIIVSGINFGLSHILWMHHPTSQTMRGAMVSLSLGLVYTGTMAALLVLDGYYLIVWALGSPFASCLAYLLAYRGLDYGRDSDVNTSESSGASPRPKRIPFIAAYAAIMGFATTQFFTLASPTAYAEIGVAVLPLVGLVCLFAGMFVLRAMNVTWFLLLSAVFFAALIMLWFVYPSLSDSILGATSSLHWISFILVACSVHQSRLLPKVGPLSSLYAMWTIYYLASGMGNVAIHIGVTSRGIICLTALAILLAAFVLARHERGLFSFEEGIVRETSNRQDALESLAAARDLTPRETDVFVLLAEGNSLRHVAETLVLSENTVKRHRSSVYQKLNIGSRQELIDIVREQRTTRPDNGQPSEALDGRGLAHRLRPRP